MFRSFRTRRPGSSNTASKHLIAYALFNKPVALQTKSTLQALIWNRRILLTSVKDGVYKSTYKLTLVAYHQRSSRFTQRKAVFPCAC